MGLLPHVLHHVGFLAGAAVISGLVGNLALFAVGQVLSLPFLLRLRRRFGTWRAPAVAFALTTAMFAVSAFVIGPAISGDLGEATPPAPTSGQEHEVHHSG